MTKHFDFFRVIRTRLAVLAMALMGGWSAPVWPAAPAPDPGVLLLLLPDGQDVKDPRVSAWLDAASEEGVRIQPVMDTAFMGMGAGALAYAGLILPDSLHTVASDSLIAAIQNYTVAGGKSLLVFDFGALTLSGNVPVYPVPKSRLSGLAGVDYVLYDQLRDQTTGLGPITGLRSTLRSLLVPPGKSMAFTGLAAVASSLDTGSTLTTVSVASTTGASGSPLLSASRVTNRAALYLPVSTGSGWRARL